MYNTTKFEAEPHRTQDRTQLHHSYMLTFSKLILFSSCLSFFSFLFVCCVLVVLNSFSKISRLCFLLFCSLKIEISFLFLKKIVKRCFLLHDFVTLIPLTFSVFFPPKFFKKKNF